MFARTAAARLAQRRSIGTRSHRAFTSTSSISKNIAPDDKPDLFLPRITERRVNEGGPGGRQSNADLRVAIFGATGFIGKHLCHQLGTFHKPEHYLYEFTNTWNATIRNPNITQELSLIILRTNACRFYRPIISSRYQSNTIFSIVALISK